MDTIRVDICYRPLRIGWAIRAGDIKAFRKVVSLSYTMWGGRYNPIIVVDREEEANRLIELFRVDLILPVGDSEAVRKFPERFPYLIKPFFGDAVFVDGAYGRKHSWVLDIRNALVHLRDTPEWKAVKAEGVRVFNWKPDDPLADVFLVQFGSYPDVEDIGIDYRDMLVQATNATECIIDGTAPIPANAIDHPSIPYISRHGLERHYGSHGGWDHSGFFVGGVTDLDDLVCHWNLRAADIPLLFVDPNHIDRYAELIPTWEKKTRENLPD